MADRAEPTGTASGPETDLVEAEVTAIRDASLRESRRDQLLDAALELFLEKGYAATTIRDICARSGVNQASLYDYVANKRDILRRLLNRLWFRPEGESLPERLTRDAPLAELLAEHFRDTWRSRRKGTLLAYRTVPHLTPEDRRTLQIRERRMMAAVAAELRRRTGLPEDDPRAEVVANFIIFANAFGPLRDWLTREVDDELVLRTVAAGIAAMVETLREPPPRPSDGQ